MPNCTPLLLLIAFVVTFIQNSLAPAVELTNQSEPPFSSKQELFDHFADPAFFKDLLFQSKDIANWLSEECNKGEDQCNDALAFMLKPFSKWNHLDAKSGLYTVASCKNQSAITHPNPKLHKILNKPIIHSLRDIHGRLWVLDFCYNIRTHPSGIWGAHFSSWCRSITGINEVWTISYFVPVPGTEYQVLSHLPFGANTHLDVENKVKELNALVERWTAEWADQNIPQ